MNTSETGTQGELLCLSHAGTNESAVAVDRPNDPMIGLVLELQFGDAWRVQRIWPSTAIRSNA